MGDQITPSCFQGPVLRDLIHPDEYEPSKRGKNIRYSPPAMEIQRVRA
jgi:hypothetical protein